MRRKILILLVAICSLIGTTGCIAQGRAFKDIAKLDGVTSVYISKAMLRLGNAMIDKEISRGVLKLDGLEVLSCDNAKSRVEAENLLDAEIKDSGAELWLSVQKPKEKVAIYAVTDGEETIAKHLYIVQSGDELQVISMSGKFDLAKIALENMGLSE